MRRVVAYLLQIIEIFGRDPGEQHPDTRHRDCWIAIFYAFKIETLAEILHELAALGRTFFLHRTLQVCADVSHGGIVLQPPATLYGRSVRFVGL